MFLGSQYLVYALLVAALIDNVAKAALCGDQECHENAECKLDKDKLQISCACKTSYQQFTDGNNVYCCRNPGETCAINRVCNHALECIEIAAEGVNESDEDLVPAVPPEAVVDETLQQTSAESQGSVSNGNNAIESPNLDAVAQGSAIETTAATELPPNDGLGEKADTTINNAAPSECPESQKCLDKCCAVDEECDSDMKCNERPSSATETTAATSEQAPECPELQKCLEKCCDNNEICDELKMECVPKQENLDSETNGEATTTKMPANDVVSADCPESQKCQDKCCAIEEKCNSETTQCVRKQTLDLAYEQTTASPQPSTELTAETTLTTDYTSTTTNKMADESLVTVIDPTAPADCPHQQKCLVNCCSPQEVCNERYECVNEGLESLLNLFDFPSEDNTDTKAEDVQCPHNHQSCMAECCNPQQTCNDSWQCVAKINVCTPGHNCAAVAEETSKKSTLAYTMVGLGCLVATMAFASFKLYDFRRSKRNLF